MNFMPMLLLSENAEKPTYIRFLVSNAAAGSVIGKGGSTINEFQTKSGARIQLSRNHEFFPGTSDRIDQIKFSQSSVSRFSDSFGFCISRTKRFRNK